MNYLSVIKIYNDLENEEGLLKYKLSQIKELKDKLEHACEHELLVKFYSKKVLKAGAYYYCPACNRKKYLCDCDASKLFKGLQIIELQNINLIDDLETLNKIRAEIISNHDFYYNKDINENEKSFKLYDAIKDYEYFEDCTLRLEKKN